MNTVITPHTNTDTSAHKTLKVAIVHDWLVIYAGAERVLEHFIDLYPQADIFSLMDHVPESQRHFLRGKKPKTSFMQNWPQVAKHYRKLLPFMPLAIEQLDLTEYDLILSSHYAVAKGVLSGPNQVHVCYCHSPMRYAWDQYHFYLKDGGLTRGPLSWFARWQLHRIRNWDARSSLSVDRFISNSAFVSERIWKFYRRESHIVYPPIDTSIFKPHEAKEDFYVTAGRLVPFKRLDLAAAAFAKMPQKKLIVLGDGPEMDRIRSVAGPNVVFLGFQPAKVVQDHMARARAFIFPSEEDFGIVPVEAMACGTPVIAFAKGGALETVLVAGRNAPVGATETGLFFDEQSPESLCDAVTRFEAIDKSHWNVAAISQHASRFSPERFKRQIGEQVDQALQEKADKRSASIRQGIADLSRG